MKQGAGEGRRVKLWKILPGLARKGIISNGTVYFPYFGALKYCLEADMHG